MHLNKLSYELYIHPCGDVKCVGDICWTNRPMPVLLTQKTCLRLPSLILLRFLLPVPNSDCERVPRVMRSFYRLAPSGLIGCLVSTWVPVSQKCGRLSRYWFWSTPGTPSASCSDRCKTSRWSLINLSISQTFCLVTIKNIEIEAGRLPCHLHHVLSWRSGCWYNEFPLPLFSDPSLFRPVSKLHENMFRFLLCKSHVYARVWTNARVQSSA